MKFTEADIAKALTGLDGWSRCDDRSAFKRRFEFDDFAEAFAFMTVIAQKAEEMDHHPEWSNVYNRVNILLTTHSEGGISAKDVTLAQFITTIFNGK